MKNKLTLFLLIAGLQFINAQKYELGEVTKAELEEKVHPNDPSAEAAFLFNIGKSSVEYSSTSGFMVVTEVEVKIKIYTKEGLSWANKEVAFYTGGNDKEFVDFSKAVTYNLVNGSIEKTKLRREGEFEEESNKYWTKKKIVMPNVKEGSIVEYKYTIKSPFVSSLPDWYFQKAIPVNYSEFTTKIPEYYIYNAYRKGSLFPKEKIDKENRTLSYNLNADKGAPGIGGAVRSSIPDYQSVNYVEIQTKFYLNNIPAIKDENYVTNVNNYAVAVQHELSGSNMPGAMFKSFSITWEDVVKNIYDNENFGGELNKTSYFEDDLKTIVDNSKSSDEKLISIFEFVKSNLKWDGFHSVYCDKGVKKAFKEKTGNVAEINLILVSMLRNAGFKADPVLVSTQSNGIAFFPSRTAFNYVIAAVEINNQYYLLDATSKNSIPNKLPIRALNWTGRIIKTGGSSEVINLTNSSPSNDQLTLMCTLSEDGSVNGKIREIYSDYNAMLYRDNNAGLTDESRLEKIGKRYNGVQITDLDVKNLQDIYKPITESFSFSSSSLVDKLDDRMYFNPMLFFQVEENPFKLEERTYPVEFDYPFNETYNIIIKIPEGYEVESMPEPINLLMENNYGGFKYNISQNLDNIQLIASLNINATLIPSQNYNAIKLFYKEMIKKHSEKIVLKKK